MVFQYAISVSDKIGSPGIGVDGHADGKTHDDVASETRFCSASLQDRTGSEMLVTSEHEIETVSSRGGT